MGSLWSNATGGASPFATQATTPTPGGGAAAKFQSILQAAGQQSQPAAQLGLSPAAQKASAKSAIASTSETTSSPASSSDSDATISANDFLTLLVTEMQNQDPTADVDPNAYIDQLVQINSLEQLISINQNLATVLGAATSPVSSVSPSTAAGTSAAPAGSAQATAVAKNKSGSAPPETMQNSHNSAASVLGAARGLARPTAVHGNLSAPGAAPAANTVGRALDGRARAVPAGHAIRDIPTRALP